MYPIVKPAKVAVGNHNHSTNLTCLKHAPKVISLSLGVDIVNLFVVVIEMKVKN